jgi:hypothetical protein
LKNEQRERTNQIEAQAHAITKSNGKKDQKIDNTETKRKEIIMLQARCNIRPSFCLNTAFVFSQKSKN